MIRAENIIKVYTMGQESVHALRGVSFTINRGEYVSIMGPSGSGKSTLLHVLGCLDKPSSGNLYIEGSNIKKTSENRLAEIRNQKIGFVFQRFNLLPKATALENVELPLIYGGISTKKRREKAYHALERVGLADRAGHRPNEMSGGQRQRVAVARALITEPSFILADEPTGSLDSKTARQIMLLFSDLNKEGNTIILVTHDDKVANETKRIIALHDGLIIRDEFKNGVETDELV